MGRHISDFNKGFVYGLYKSGWTMRKIEQETTISKSTVNRIINEIEIQNKKTRKVGSGFSKKLNRIETEALAEISVNNPKLNIKEIKREFSKLSEKRISNNSITNYLSGEGIHAYVAKQKPSLTRKQKSARFELSKFYLGLTEDYWRKVVFSDEATFRLGHTKKKVLIYCKKGEQNLEKNIVPTVKFAKAKLNVWCCFSYNGVGSICFETRNIDSGVYKNILATHLPRSLMRMGMNDNDYVFMQDGAAAHTSKMITEYLEQKNIELHPHPSQSPDLNPIENLFNLLRERLYKKEYNTIDELKIAIEEIWYGFDMTTIRSLVDSMPRRCKEVYRSKGGNTKY